MMFNIILCLGNEMNTRTFRGYALDALGPCRRLDHVPDEFPDGREYNADRLFHLLSDPRCLPGGSPDSPRVLHVQVVGERLDVDGNMNWQLYIPEVLLAPPLAYYHVMPDSTVFVPPGQVFAGASAWLIFRQLIGWNTCSMSVQPAAPHHMSPFMLPDEMDPLSRFAWVNRREMAYLRDRFHNGEITTWPLEHRVAFVAALQGDSPPPLVPLDGSAPRVRFTSSRPPLRKHRSVAALPLP